MVKTLFPVGRGHLFYKFETVDILYVELSCEYEPSLFKLFTLV